MTIVLSTIDYFELFLAVDCLVLIFYNLYIFVKNKVYKSWSTTSMVLSCSLLLLTRLGFLVIFAFDFDKSSN